MEGSKVLESILNHLNMRPKAFSDAIGNEKPQAIYDIQKGKTKNISESMAIKIISVFPEFNKSWLMSGDGEMLKTESYSNTGEMQNVVRQDKEVYSTTQRNCQPILDIRVCAGSGIGLDGNENKVIEWVSIPKFEGCTGVTVFGDSMYDKFKSGDIVFVRPISGRSDIDFGQCYVVITREDRYIKNLYESERGDEFVSMVSYNIETNPDGRRKYPDRNIKKEEILFLYKVAGKLRRSQL